ncbi:MAG: manganese efflux pump MntP family protein [Anaerolineales bacterium]|jgi:putative Mn2+ efflux pump MntP
MNAFEVLLIAIGMAMDAFAVCLGVGTIQEASGPRRTFRLAWHFGLFQFIMPVLGWYVGKSLLHFISPFDRWLAFGLLAFVGGRMIQSGRGSGEREMRRDPSRGWSLVLLSFATSIDALAVGLSLGLLGITIWYPAAVIGVVTGLISWAGVILGNRLGVKFGQRMEIIGGVVLILIGLKILIG